MRTRVLSVTCCIILVSTFIVLPAKAQQDTSPSQVGNEKTVEGAVVSATRDTLVVRTDENQFELFTYERGAVRAKSLALGSRVRVTAGPPDENGTRAARDVTVLTTATADKGAQAAPLPQNVRDLEKEIRRESRRWRLGVHAGAAFDPELFAFGIQSQIGPIFHPRVLFRPNAEFAYGEVTDMVAVNLEAIYRFSAASRRGNWTPYLGAGPALNFIHQNFESGRNIDFGNFDYETGLNILAGMQSRRGTFVELKTSLYSGPAPKLRLIFGYNF